VCLTESICDMSYSYFEVTIVPFWQSFFLFYIIHLTFYTVIFPAVVYSVTLTRVCGSQSNSFLVKTHSVTVSDIFMMDVSCYTALSNDVLLKVHVPLKPQLRPRAVVLKLCFSSHIHLWCVYGTLKSEHRTNIM
jgi:hypothetical protein